MGDDAPAAAADEPTAVATQADMRTLDANRTDEDRRFLVRADVSAGSSTVLRPVDNAAAVRSACQLALIPTHPLHCAACAVLLLRTRAVGEHGSSWSLCSAWPTRATSTVRTCTPASPPAIAAAATAATATARLCRRLPDM